MEHFVVSARKYRPQTFKDVVGQQAITNTLLNAIEHNHLAQALLFTGPRGVGKTTCARILAKRINQRDGEYDANEDFAFNIFELDAASNNSVDDIRSLIDQVRIPPQVGNYKVYIIDEVHMLSQAAFNAFLKTLEEPPKHAIFILATTEKHKIIPTILSRCQIFDFKRITVKDAKEYLTFIAQQEGVQADDDALHIIAQKADGAMRDALSIYDRVVSFSGKNLTRQAVTENLNVLDYDTYLTATTLILQNEIPQLLLLFNEILSHGFDGHHFIAGLASHFRDLLVCKDPKTINLLEVGDNTKALYYQQSQGAPASFLMKGIELANNCDLQYKNSRNQRLLVELCLMQLASITFSEEEKKKETEYIIPPNHFTGTAIPPPAFKLSPKEKELIVNNEYATGDSAAPAQAQVAEQRIVPGKCDSPDEKASLEEKKSSEEKPFLTPEESKPAAEKTSEKKPFLTPEEPKPAAEKTSEKKPFLTPEEPKPAAEKTSEEKPFLTPEKTKSAAEKTSEEKPLLTPEESKYSAEKTSEEKPFLTPEKTKSAAEKTSEEKPFLTPEEAKSSSSETPSSAPKNVVEEEKTNLNREQPRKISALSLKSVQQKKELEARKREAKAQEEEEKNGIFTEEEMQAAWQEYSEKIDVEGERILASIMQSDKPRLEDLKICVEFPNQTMKLDLERTQYLLMGFLKEKLQNTHLQLQVTVNEKTEKKYAYTPIEKFEKLKGKNPLMEKLRTTFDLDI